MEMVMSNGFQELSANEMENTDGGKKWWDRDWGDVGYGNATGWLNFWGGVGESIYDLTH